MAGKATSDEHGGGVKPHSKTVSRSAKQDTELQKTTDFTPKGEPVLPNTRLPSTIGDDAAAPDSHGQAVPDIALPEMRYAIGKLHAEGGIGQVWLARDTQLERDVAVKMIRPGLHGHDRVRRRFIQEARITGQLEHPGIVPVYELVSKSESGSPFYSMRFVHGRTLAEASVEYHRKRQAGDDDPLGLVSLLSAFVTVCNTVAFAHSRGVIHRDLKGDNVLLGDFGEVFVLDWGIAKMLGTDEETGGATPETQSAPAKSSPAKIVQTIEGNIVGTPAYMAPEQTEGRSDIDHRTDIYGLGAILYEILTGRPPFVGSNTVEVLEMVRRDAPVPPREIWPEVPEMIEAVCLRALSKQPADRHDSAAALGQEIQSWQEVQRRQAEEELRRSRERFALAVRGSQDGLWDWDLRSNEVFFSPRWKSIIGYEDGELPNRLDEWEKRLHPDERERVMAANYAHINGTTSHYEYEYRLRHKDGSYRWILARGVALRDAEGRAYRMAGSHVDITARKQLTQQLQTSQRRYRAVVEASPCGILIVDARGAIRENNAQAARLLGVPSDLPADASLIELCKRATNEDGSEIDGSEIEALLQPDIGGERRKLTLTFRADDGSQNRVSIESHPIDSQESEDQSDTLVFVHEVSERVLKLENKSPLPLGEG